MVSCCGEGRWLLAALPNAASESATNWVRSANGCVDDRENQLMLTSSKSWIIAVTALCLLLTSCSGASGPGGSEEDETATIRVVTATGPGFSYFGLFVAKHLGFFEEEGLNVEITEGGGGSNAAANVIGGGAEIALVSTLNVAELAAAGQPVSIIAPTQNGFAMQIIASTALVQEAGLSAESSLQEKAMLLSGHNVGVTDVGGSSGDLVRFVLSQAGLGEDDVSLVQIPSNAGLLSALEEDKVAAIATLSPTTDKAVADGFGFPLVVPTRGDLPEDSGATDFSYVVMMALDDWVANKNESVVKLLRAYQRALDLVQDDPDRAKDAFYEYIVSLGAGDPFGEELRDAAFESQVQGIPEVVLPDPERVQDALEYFGVADKVSADQIVNSEPAESAMTD